MKPAVIRLPLLALLFAACGGPGPVDMPNPPPEVIAAQEKAPTAALVPIDHPAPEDDAPTTADNAAPSVPAPGAADASAPAEPTVEPTVEPTMEPTVEPPADGVPE